MVITQYATRKHMVFDILTQTIFLDLFLVNIQGAVTDSSIYEQEKFRDTAYGTPAKVR